MKIMNIKYYLPLIHPKKISIYPFFRLGGFGLGNMLFPFFRALTASIRDGANLLYPHHQQIQPRNFLRERTFDSLRNYADDFEKFNWSYLTRIESFMIYQSRLWQNESQIGEFPNILFTGTKNYFYDLIDYREIIQNYIYFSYGINKEIKKNNVAFHLRLGDFLINKQNLESEKVIHALNYFTEKLLCKVEIYSDYNSDQIKRYLGVRSLPKNIKLVKSVSTMFDLINMSKSEYICGNPYSTFVEWSRFLSFCDQKSYSLVEKSLSDKISVSPLKWKNFL